MNLVRAIIIVTIVVTITNFVEYYVIKNNPERLTILFVILMIIVTVVPIAINFWVHLR